MEDWDGDLSPCGLVKAHFLQKEVALSLCNFTSCLSGTKTLRFIKR